MRRWPAAARCALLATAALAASFALQGSTPADGTAAPVLAPSERAAIIALGPWPPMPIRDAANPASGDGAGIALGESLFHSPRLSPSGLRCASCHEPWRHFADGRVVAQGLAAGWRNTPSLLDAARHRHYGWDSERDQLWRQSLRPLQDPREMPASAAQVAALVRGDASLSARYRQVFGQWPGTDDARVLHDVGLALAAYVETLATPRAPFDDWRDRLAGTSGADEPATSDAFAADARRGLRLFVGRAGCIACHHGPSLSDDRLHVSLVHSLEAPGVPDTGHAGRPANAFRTPGLRDVASTGPWFHDGSAASLCDAVQPHAADAGDAAPPPLGPSDRRALAAFLRTLSADAAIEQAPACDDRGDGRVGRRGDRHALGARSAPGGQDAPLAWAPPAAGLSGGRHVS